MLVAQILKVALHYLLGAAADQRRRFLGLLETSYFICDPKPTVPLFYLLTVLVFEALRVVPFARFVYLLALDLFE